MKVPMQACKSNALSAFGNQLVDDISLPVQQLNLLFSALLLTAVGVFIGANLLFLDTGTLARSAQIALPCLGLLLIFYAASRQFGSVIWGGVCSPMGWCGCWYIANYTLWHLLFI